MIEKSILATYEQSVCPNEITIFVNGVMFVNSDLKSGSFAGGIALYGNPLREYLDQMGFKTAVNYPTALPTLEAFEYFGHKHSDFPVAKENQECILSLPLYPEISEEEGKYVANSIEFFYKT